MGILKSIPEMRVEKLAILGVLWLLVGVPALALLVVMVLGLTIGVNSIPQRVFILIAFLALGIPGFSLFVTMAICVIVGPLALLSAPWKDRSQASLSQSSPSSRLRNLSFGIVLLTIGAGITGSLYVIPKIAGIEGIPMLFGTLILFGGLGLIVSYFVVSAIEKREKKKE